MAVPGKPHLPENAPADLVARELFAVDAYLASFDAEVLEVDRTDRRVLLSRTASSPAVVDSRATPAPLRRRLVPSR